MEIWYHAGTILCNFVKGQLSSSFSHSTPGTSLGQDKKGTKTVKIQKSDQTGDWTQDLLDIYQML